MKNLIETSVAKTIDILLKNKFSIFQCIQLVNEKIQKTDCYDFNFF